MLGPRGFTVLSLAGIVGVCLALLGWSQRGTGLVAGLVPTSATSAAPAASSSPASAAPSASGSAAAPSPAPSLGPALSSEPYASYAYQVWPGQVSSNNRIVMAGFGLNVARKSNGITLNVVMDGQKMTSGPQFFAGGAKVYVVDTNLGDEGGSVDYSLGDDGLIVTNAQNRILQ